MKNSIDPFTVEVIRHALTAAAEEMSFVVMRSARSPLLREAGDLSSALTDHKGDLIAQGRDIPIHLGVMSFTVKKFLERVAGRAPAAGRRVVPQPARGRRQSPAGRQGDPADLPRRPAVRLRRQPRPLGRHRRRLGRAATSPPPPRPGRRACASRRCACSPPTASTRRSSISCWPTCAARPSARATSWPRWRRRGRPRRGWCGFARSTARPRSAPRSTGWTIFPKRRCARRSRGLPDGVYEGEDFLDDDGPGGQPRRRAGAHRDQRATTPASTSARSDDAVAGPLNTTPFVAMAAVYYAIKAVAGPEIQPNGGCYRALEVIDAAGLAVRARHRQAGGGRQPRDLATAPSTPSCAPSSRRCRSG